MKNWEYYSTPESHPWVGTEEVEAFKDSLPGNLTEASRKYAAANFVWSSDQETRNELTSLEMEFEDDVCWELGISRKLYERVNPYEEIIGSPAEHEYPSSDQYRKMYEYIKNKLEL